MKVIKKYLLSPILILIFTSFNSLGMAADIAAQEEEAFLKVDSVALGGDDISRYVFSVCYSSQEECIIVGRSHGYTYEQVISLSGKMQKYVGAPLLMVGETIGGVVVAFAAGMTLVPTASTALAGVILWGGATTGAAGPSLLTIFDSLSAYSAIRALSPAYHWKKGNTKSDLKSAVKTLEREKDAKAAIIYHSKNFDDLEEFSIAIDVVDRILVDL